MSDWWERAAKVYQADGYLVLGCWRPRKIGDICETGATVDVRDEKGILPQPFRIIAETTGEEFARQAVMAGYPEPHIPFGTYFYRTITE